MTQQCETCKHWRKYRQPMGECHRYAPRPGSRGGRVSLPSVGWPPTSPRDSCGDWQPAPVGNAAPPEGRELRLLTTARAVSVNIVGAPTNNPIHQLRDALAAYDALAGAGVRT